MLCPYTAPGTPLWSFYQMVHMVLGILGDAAEIDERYFEIGKNRMGEFND